MRRIFFAGDSICHHYDITKYPQAGLPQGLELYVKKEIKFLTMHKPAAVRRALLQKVG